MMELKNEIIQASAGTGKTYSLVQRYLWLLEHGVEPERIAAMTFTRKAAGEFFERILQELAHRGENPARRALALPLLRKVVRRMDQLRLGTIDAFFAGMTQCLPFELGLTGQVALMSDTEGKRAVDDVLNNVLLAFGKMNDPAALDELREAWKAASLTHEQGRPAEALAKWCDSLHNLYIECPQPGKWGGAEAIWGPERAAVIAGETSGLAAAVAHLEDCVDYRKFDKRAEKKWQAFFAEALAYDGFSKVDKSSIGFMLSPDRGDHSRLRLGGVEWMMWKKTPLDERLGNALADVLDLLLARALQTHLRRTRAQREIVRLYETTYHRLVRSRGRLVFSDLAWLLCGRLQTGMAGQDWEEMRTRLEYRMDARHDHWLLDEFQDTSERQWEVMAPLLEEARQDAEERRSVFLVGDVKQSIYLWRQAEPELFGHVEQAWKGSRLKITPLNESYRSCPEVLAMVNGVFHEAQGDLEGLFPGLGQLWTYREHRCSPKVASLTGHAAFIRLPIAPDDGESEDPPVTLGAANLIREIDPVGRGLSCAVLVRTNKTATRVSDALRRLLGVEVICESRESVVVDNPSTLALLSLVQLALHPGDTAAWEHVLMTPLRHEVARLDLGRKGLSARVRSEVGQGGFLPLLQQWSEALRRHLPEEDAFTRRRLAQLLDFAADFDESGSRNLEEFIAAAREHTVREEGASSQAVQVMTVHQSKGLQFDVVILPELQGEALDAVSRNRLFVARGERGNIRWMLDKPESKVVEADPVLSAELKREKARQAFEGLCRFYVAMTRARLGLYALLGPVKKNQANEGRVLTLRLEPVGQAAPYPMAGAGGEVVWEAGSRTWFTSHRREAAPAAETERVTTGGLGALIRRVNAPLERRAPSGEESFSLKGVELLSPVRESKRQFGTRVHELLSWIPWVDEVADPVAVWKARGLVSEAIPPTGEGDAAAQEALRVLSAPEARPWFTRAGQPRDAWTERRFDYIENRGWVSGIIDRVVVERDAGGAARGATILDFKTDAVPTEEELQARAAGYAPQIALYVPAVARLTGLPPDKIGKALIFTAAGRVVPV